MFFPARRNSFELPVPNLPVWDKVSGGDALAIDLDDLKNFLNIPLQDTYFDAEKTAFARAAQSAIESFCHINLTPAVWTCYLSEFVDTIRIDRRPFTTVTKIEYAHPETGEITTLPTDTYGVAPYLQKTGIVTRANGAQWPDTATRIDAVRITVSCGFAVGSLPSDIKQALFITVAALDRSRADEGAADKSTNTIYGLKNQTAASILPPEAKALLNPHTYKTLGIA